ncbi:hypothetical protein REPUB_Repub03eG0116800 [Reevesia pubescens]
MRSLYWLKAVEEGMVKMRHNVGTFQDIEGLKFNVDGSARGKPGPAGCGGILRDSKGVVLGVFFGHLRCMDSNMAEVNAIKIALELFLSSGWVNKKSLTIESDSYTVVSWVSKRALRPWKKWKIFNEIDRVCK